jgi:hypothetical protein
MRCWTPAHCTCLSWSGSSFILSTSSSSRHLHHKRVTTGLRMKRPIPKMLLTCPGRCCRWRSAGCPDRRACN